MDFTFSQDQELLREAVANFLTKEVTPDRIRDRWQSDTGHDEQLWQQMVELGLFSMLVPERLDGQGMNELDFIQIAVEAGRAALPENLVDTALVATPLLAAISRRDHRCGDVLQKVANGEAKIAVDHRISIGVLDAHIADYLILPSANQIHLVSAKDVDLVPLKSIDPSRRLFDVKWTPCETTCVADGREGGDLWAKTLNRGALGNAAQLLGLAEAMVKQSVTYSGDREQFGKPIGSNQALKHHMANCAVKNEFAKAPLYRAAYTLSTKPSHSGYVVSHAKVAASEAALLAAKNSIQVHGAMGYTWECDLHIWMKKAWVLDKSWGDAGFHKYRVHQWLLNDKAKIGADKTFGEQI